ncbi:MAG: response regulator [Pseudomonadales bacterium]|nr:response regulator [Pseudomonadales bacterium]
MSERILFVDDEPKILEAYRRTLRKSFTVVPAESGKQALELMASEGPFPVVVSDMQMPEMNGVELLTKIKELYPNTIRMMLTGNADQQTAVDAINTSDVFCFLNKPCPPDKMTEKIKAALKQFDLQHAEKELLDGTVRGSISALGEILSIARPRVFGRITQIKSLAARCAEQMQLDNVWEVESTALLSQIGLVSLPETVLEKIFAGETLCEAGQAQFERHPEVAAQLISQIPRMDSIADAIRCQFLDYSGRSDFSGEARSKIPVAARIVRAVSDLIAAMSPGVDPKSLLAKMAAKPGAYDPKVLAALEVVLVNYACGNIIEIDIGQLLPGTVLAQDIVTNSGALLIEQGQEVCPSMVARLVNFCQSGEISDRVKVYAGSAQQDETIAEAS